MGLRSGFCHFRCTYTARRIRPGTHLSYEEHPGAYPSDGHRCGIMAARQGPLRRSLHAERTHEVVPRCMFRHDERVHDDGSVSPAGPGSPLPGAEHVAPSPDCLLYTSDAADDLL